LLSCYGYGYGVERGRTGNCKGLIRSSHQSVAKRTSLLPFHILHGAGRCCYTVYKFEIMTRPPPLSLVPSKSVKVLRIIQNSSVATGPVSLQIIPGDSRLSDARPWTLIPLSRRVSVMGRSTYQGPPRDELETSCDRWCVLHRRWWIYTHLTICRSTSTGE
jgi:hypothetical protein